VERVDADRSGRQVLAQRLAERCRRVDRHHLDGVPPGPGCGRPNQAPTPVESRPSTTPSTPPVQDSVVERTHAWITGHRRLSRNYERLPAHSEAMIK
jgi:hypothetical protein